MMSGNRLKIINKYDQNADICLEEFDIPIMPIMEKTMSKEQSKKQKLRDIIKMINDERARGKLDKNEETVFITGIVSIYLEAEIASRLEPIISRLDSHVHKLYERAQSRYGR